MTNIELPFRIQDQGQYGRIAQPYTHQTDILQRLKKLKDGTFHRMKVDAAMAADLLDLNTDNRIFKPMDIHIYAADMYENKWVWNGEALILSDEFRLIDGQKRLWALLSANEKRLEKGREPIVLEFNITVGVVDKNRVWLDLGVNRSASDVLNDHGFVTDRFVTAATVRHIYYLKNYNRISKTMPKGVKMRNPTLIEWLSSKKRYERLKACVSRARNVHRDFPAIVYTLYAALWYIFEEIDPELTDRFFNKLATGHDLSMARIEDNNIAHLRLTLEKMVKRSYDTPQIFRGDEKVKYIVRAFNAIRDKEKLDKKFEIDAKTMDIEKPH